VFSCEDPALCGALGDSVPLETKKSVTEALIVDPE
jgi:hypothetical protein